MWLHRIDSSFLDLGDYCLFAMIVLYVRTTFEDRKNGFYVVSES